MKRCFAEGALAGESVDQLKAGLKTDALNIHDEDVASCRAIGAHGATLVPSEACILTHCNAGALATAGYGTALGVIRGAIEAGKRVKVLADETRPFLQGSRLTAWELMKDGIDTTVITDTSRSISWWSAPIGSRPTATPPTRSAPTPWRF
jgi:methylthioribose-1-phosphate isomerase